MDKDERLQELKEWPLEGLCGECGDYSEKISKDGLCKNCIITGTRAIGDFRDYENIAKFLKLREPK